MSTFWLGLAAVATDQLTVTVAVAGCNLHSYMNTHTQLEHFMFVGCLHFVRRAVNVDQTM
jgi:hypothetical protein